MDSNIEKTNATDEDKSVKSGPSSSWTSILVLAALVTTIGSSVPVGYNMGVVNNPAEIIKLFCIESFRTRYEVELSESSLNILWSSIVSAFTIGGVIGSFSGGFVADKVGRKGGIFVTNGIAILGAIFFISCYPANSVEMLFIGRILVGLAGGMTTGIIPMYLIEIAPLHLKGSMGVTYSLGITSGILFSQILGLNSILGKSETWHYLFALFGILILLSMPILYILPESPKYLLIIKDDYDSAIKSLCQINKKQADALTEDIAELCAEKEDAKDNANKWSLWRVISTPKLRIGLLLVCFMQAGQQTSGINAVFYYSSSIFDEANLSESDAELATIGTGVVNTIMAVLSIVFIARFGRKTLYILSTGTATVFLILLCCTIVFIESVDWMPILCIVIVFLFIVSFQLGLGPISYFIGSELFEVGPRPSAMALGSLFNWTGNFLVGMTFPSLQSAVGAYSFLFFALSSGLLCAFVIYFLPETKGKSPSEIALVFSERSNA